MRSSSVFAVAAFAAIAFSGAAAFASTYCVAAGDSLWTIAAQHHVTVSALEAKNHLTDSSVLQIGQQLKIPDVAAAIHGRHFVAANHRRTQKKVALHIHRLRAHHHVAAPMWSNAVATTDIQVARALWAATHAGYAAPVIPGVAPYSVAERAFALEAHITTTALRYLGVPYSWGGTSFSGVDCSGFVWSVFHHNGIELPRMADEQFAATHHVTWSTMRPGDLVFFETYTAGASHVGIYLGHGRFIHASSSEGVRIDSLGMSYYADRFLGAGRPRE